MNRFRGLARVVPMIESISAEGRLLELSGLRAKVAGLAAPVGSTLLVEGRDGRRIRSEVKGIQGDCCTVALIDQPQAVAPGARVFFLGTQEALLSVRTAAGRTE